jgi:hypothetical protein
MKGIKRIVSEEFDDPALKSAVQRVWSGETAPPQLRAAVQELIRTEQRGAQLQTIGAAIAAAILLAASLGTWFLCGEEQLSSLDRGGSSSYLSSGEVALPPGAAQSMVRTHERTSAAPDHEFDPITGDNFAVIGDEISHDLNIPVVAADLPNWQFVGAGETTVWGHTVGHLLYRQGSKTVSLFSIPAADLDITGPDGTYVGNVGQFVVAGFKKGDGLYCVVCPIGKGKLKSQQQVAVSLRNMLRKQFAKIAYSH